jgi:hypothetical protein
VIFTYGGTTMHLIMLRKLVYATPILGQHEDLIAIARPAKERRI